MSKPKTFNNNHYLSRDLQRDYRKILELVKKTNQPAILYKYNQPEAVLLSLSAYEELQNQQNKAAASKEWGIDELEGLFKTSLPNNEKSSLKKTILQEWQNFD